MALGMVFYSLTIVLHIASGFPTLHTLPSDHCLVRLPLEGGQQWEGTIKHKGNPSYYSRVALALELTKGNEKKICSTDIMSERIVKIAILNIYTPNIKKNINQKIKIKIKNKKY